MKKRKKINYGKRNIVAKLSRRLLNKDLAAYFEISLSSLKRYKKGERKIPAFILAKGADLLNLTPKATTKKTRLKKKRFNKIEKTLDSGIVELSKQVTAFKNTITFLYTGDNKGIIPFIHKIKEKYGDGDHVVYRIVRQKIIDNKKVVDSTYNYSISALSKLEEKFKQLLSKYQKFEEESDNFLHAIYIERTEYI